MLLVFFALLGFSLFFCLLFSLFFFSSFGLTLFPLSLSFRFNFLNLGSLFLGKFNNFSLFQPVSRAGQGAVDAKDDDGDEECADRGHGHYLRLYIYIILVFPSLSLI